MLKEKIEDYTNFVATMHQVIESERRYRVLSATALPNEVKDRKATEESLALELAHIRDYLHFLKSLNFTTENENIIRTEKEGLKPTLQQREGKTQGLKRNLEIERELLEIGGLVPSRLGDSSSDGGE